MCSPEGVELFLAVTCRVFPPPYQSIITKYWEIANLSGEVCLRAKYIKYVTACP